MVILNIVLLQVLELPQVCVSQAGPWHANPNVVSYVAGFNGEGDWDAGTVYETGDVVAYAGNSYVAIHNLCTGCNSSN